MGVTLCHRSRQHMPRAHEKGERILPSLSRASKGRRALCETFLSGNAAKLEPGRNNAESGPGPKGTSSSFARGIGTSACLMCLAIRLIAYLSQGAPQEMKCYKTSKYRGASTCCAGCLQPHIGWQLQRTSHRRCEDYSFRQFCSDIAVIHLALESFCVGCSVQISGQAHRIHACVLQVSSAFPSMSPRLVTTPTTLQA